MPSAPNSDQGKTNASPAVAAKMMTRNLFIRVMPPNDSVHLPGRLQGRHDSKNPHAGPVKCNALLASLSHPGAQVGSATSASVGVEVHESRRVSSPCRSHASSRPSSPPVVLHPFLE